jgi:protein TonB
MILAAYLQDRMFVALVVALGLHALVALGVGFEVTTQTPPVKDLSLDIVLVNWESEEAPDDPDYLAQASQRGGGDTSDPVRPTEQVAALTPSLDQGEAEMNMLPAAPEESVRARRYVTASEADVSVEREESRDDSEDTPLPSAEELILQAQKMARLNAEVSDTRMVRSRSPRRKFISANTRQYEFASYMQAWVAKVERVGNLNYPDEARRRNLSGSLIMTVGINTDGSIESITIQQPSGHDTLDQAARQIVQIAAPYTPLPPELTSSVDVLHITRTWKFSQGTLSKQ